MIAVDTNILVYAHRQETPWHKEASAYLKDLCTGHTLWAIPWPCVHEFVATVTNVKKYHPATPLDTAFAQMDLWLSSPKCRLIGETPSHWGHLTTLMRKSKTTGGQTHDARIAAICLQHGVSELWTLDRDFNKFPSLKVRNPFV